MDLEEVRQEFADPRAEGTEGIDQPAWRSLGGLRSVPKARGRLLPVHMVQPGGQCVRACVRAHESYLPLPSSNCRVLAENLVSLVQRGHGPGLLMGAIY